MTSLDELRAALGALPKDALDPRPTPGAGGHDAGYRRAGEAGEQRLAGDGGILGHAIETSKPLADLAQHRSRDRRHLVICGRRIGWKMGRAPRRSSCTPSIMRVWKWTFRFQPRAKALDHRHAAGLE
jgi:hypothetical protein